MNTIFKCDKCKFSVIKSDDYGLFQTTKEFKIMEKELANRYNRRIGIIDILYFDRCYEKRIGCDYRCLMLNFGSL